MQLSINAALHNYVRDQSFANENTNDKRKNQGHICQIGHACIYGIKGLLFSKQILYLGFDK
jgi:hypothetical protein